MWRVCILRPVEVLGMQHQVAVGEPVRSASVKLTSPSLQQRVVDRITDQGMCEQKCFTLRPHEKLRHETVGSVVGPVEQLAQGLPAEALTEHRGRLQGRLVRRIEPIQSSLDEVLQRARHARLTALLGMAQELLQEERVAGGPLDALLGEPVRRIEDGARQRQRLLALAAGRGRWSGAEPRRPGSATPGRADRPRSARS